ncbi:beta strand repeat-containing protein [Clostridium fungisolvens]|uniref:Uncharacterized protein n=1 Tax=Clostridium fungisolvens TaxID=1604897 RepID=A0A6V8SDG5_9CLOT|nr:SPOCS domain-containing protein [Clostridium fungisolvens]GFP74495.1 hypothetical protein bsdtw1_00547 [Clostridium fungisolvens]
MAIIGGVNLGNLPSYLFFFQNGSVDANWQGATKGFVGDVAVKGTVAKERTSGTVPYAGTIYTDDNTLGAWQQIVNDNPGQASGVTGQVSRINGLQADLISAFNQINALPATPGFESRSSTSLDGLNTQNGINETFVINITSGFQVSSQIDITGDAGDVYILRWDTDADPTNGYQGQVKFQSGGAIVPHGGLTPANFINVAGDINSSGGGSTPPPPYPQGPRLNDGQGALINGGQDFSGGGFFTGYWLTTGAPTTLDPVSGLYIGETQSLSNGIFVGGWYTLTTKFSMTSGTSGVHVSPNPNTVNQPAIKILKEVSPDNGLTWFDANNPTGPNILQGTNPQFRYTVTNTGNVTLTNVQVTDNVYGLIGALPSLAAGASFQWIITKPWAAGQQTNIATATGVYGAITVTDTNPANYFGVAGQPSINVLKEVSPDNGVTWFDANTPPGPNIPQGTNPQFRYTVTNDGNVPLTNVIVTDNVYGLIGTLSSLAVGESFQWVITRPWASGQHTNTVTATGVYGNQTVSDSDVANYFGVTPSISVLKEVSPDNGVTWFDADIAPGPSIPQGTNPQFRYTVTNTGTVTLTNVQVTDNLYSLIGTLPSLAAGSSFQWITTEPWAVGQESDLATATGVFQGQTVTASNPAHYLGTTNAPSITILKEVSPDNGVTWFDANTAPGPSIPQGTSPQFRYTVTNNGSVILSDVVVTDNVYGSIGTVPTLAVGESQQWTNTETWAAGQHVNIATATGQYLGQTVTALNPANYFGVTVAINVLKEVSPDNGVTWLDANTAPGPSIPQGTNPRFRFTVTNTGTATLSNVQVTDDVYGLIGSLPSLAPGSSFQWSITVPWAVGAHLDTATATGTFQGQTVTDTNPANYLGVTPSISILKEVSPDNGINWFDANTAPGPDVLQGTNPQFRFTVTNSGTVTLTNVQVNDNRYGLIGTLPSLVSGASFQWVVTEPWQAGQQLDIATATGVYQGQTISATNPANYFGVVPAIKIIKQVSPDNGVTWFDADVSPGPSIPQGTSPQFRFIVTNIGTITLTNVQVSDDVYGFIGSLPSLASGSSFQWTITVPWASGQHVDIATATGSAQGQTVTDTNPAYNVGIVEQPSINILKEVSPDNGVTWLDANTAPGPNIPQGISPQFRFTVTNTGNTTLTNVQVIDNVYGPIGTLPTLPQGASFQWVITTPWVVGQHVNTATATGTSGGQTVTDTDLANYFGASPQITVVKEVSPDNGVTWFDANTPPGPNVLQGTNPQFRFTVTNTGNVTLTNVQVTDDVYGLIGTLPSLAPGAFFQWIITRPWSVGQHVNTATATGTSDGQTVTDTDLAHYVGVSVAPSITVLKEVSPDNGVTWFDANTPPGPSIPEGTSPQFRYTVTNSGNTTLTNVQVTDNIYGLIGTLPSLAPGASFQWVNTEMWTIGQHTNTATATGVFQGQTVSDTDQANYFGIAPSIAVKKEVSPDNGVTWLDAEVPPGPSIPQGTDPQFRFTVTNNGNVTLTNVQVTDDVYGLIGSLPSLAPGASFQWMITRPWAAGQHVNMATATGVFQGRTVTDTDLSHYFGVPAQPSIDVEKLISADGGKTFVDADTPPGPEIPQTINPIFKFIVTNTGNVVLSNITLLDSVLGQITVPNTTLNPGQSFTVIKVGNWSLGQHFNTATVTGRFGTITVTDMDQAYYVGIVIPTSFKQLSVDENLTIPFQKPNVEDILNTIVDVEIVTTRVIETVAGTSEEGQILTGHKLLIEGRLHQKIEYIAAEPTQTVHNAEFSVPFSSFIILPEDFVEDSVVNVVPYVEDVYVKLIDCRTIFKNVTLRLEAQII